VRLTTLANSRCGLMESVLGVMMPAVPLGPSGYSKESCIARLVTELPQDRLHAQVGVLQTLSQPCLDPVA